jgi:hypothetical protein
LAIDLNSHIPGNRQPPGATPAELQCFEFRPDDRLVRLFKVFEWSWGGDFSLTDRMHFGKGEGR